MTKKQIQFKPLGDRVLVRRLEEKETKKGGIILPDTAKKARPVTASIPLFNASSAFRPTLAASGNEYTQTGIIP